jgi:hypothetical protein
MNKRELEARYGGKECAGCHSKSLSFDPVGQTYTCSCGTCLPVALLEKGEAPPPRYDPEAAKYEPTFIKRPADER